MRFTDTNLRYDIRITIPWPRTSLNITKSAAKCWCKFNSMTFFCCLFTEKSNVSYNSRNRHNPLCSDRHRHVQKNNYFFIHSVDFRSLLRRSCQLFLGTQSIVFPFESNTSSLEILIRFYCGKFPSFPLNFVQSGTPFLQCLLSKAIHPVDGGVCECWILHFNSQDVGSIAPMKCTQMIPS
jgi:hypothetical protein